MWGFFNNTKNNTPVLAIFNLFAPNTQYVSIILYKTEKKILLYFFVISRRLLGVLSSSYGLDYDFVLLQNSPLEDRAIYMNKFQVCSKNMIAVVRSLMKVHLLLIGN